MSNECCHLKIQCSLVPSGVRQRPKQKAKSDSEELAQPKQLKPIIEVVGLRPELTMQEVLLEQSELLRDLWGLMKSQLDELKGLWWSVTEMGFAMDKIVEWMSWVKEGNESGNDSMEYIGNGTNRNVFREKIQDDFFDS